MAYGSGPTNEERAEWARNAVRHFGDLVRAGGEELETLIGDLLVDLRHLCAEEGIDFEEKCSGSKQCFDEEVAEEAEDEEENDED